MAKLQELTAIFLREKHRWDQTVIAECELPPENGEDEFWGIPITVKVYDCPEGELDYQLSYRFYGNWSEFANKYNGEKQRQFHAKTFVHTTPHGRAGTIAYLKKCPGVGEATARKLWEKLQGDAVRILRTSPAVAVAAVSLSSFTETKAEAAAAYLKQHDGLENCFIDLADLLDGRGFSRGLPKRLIAEFGGRAPEIIRRNPWKLLRFKGAGVLRVDKLFLDLGGNPAALRRQAVMAWHALNNSTDGHTWFPVEFMVEGLRGRLGGAEMQAKRALIFARRAGCIATKRDAEKRLWVGVGKKTEDERCVAESVSVLSREPSHWPILAGMDISEHQADRLAAAMQGPISVFGGSPGTGKTYTAARLVARVASDIGLKSIAVCAPTGKAAVRITEALNGYGLAIRAKTMHSTLGVESKSEGDGWGFIHNEINPMPYHLIVIDEFSMVSTDLWASFLRAVPRGCHLLLVGDTNQLPPVGHGAPLRDMIRAGLPYGELKEIRRNAGTIVRACAAIRDGIPFQTDEVLDIRAEEPRNLKLIHCHNNSMSANRIVDTLGKLAGKGLDPVWDCQVLVAVNENGDLSRRALNQRLQGTLNPRGQQMLGSPFRTLDKIICLKNGFMPVINEDSEHYHPEANQEQTEDEKVYLANGEIGRVVGQVERVVFARFEAPLRVIKIPRGKVNDAGSDDDDADEKPSKTGCNFDLAYAITVHKSQGSEWPVVLIGLDDSMAASMVCSREHLYTSISRAKRFCLMFGKRATADGYCKRVALPNRKTFLTELIQQERTRP